MNLRLLSFAALLTLGTDTGAGAAAGDATYECAPDKGDCNSDNMSRVRDIARAARRELEDEEAVFKNVVLHSFKAEAGVSIYYLCGVVTTRDVLSGQPATEPFVATRKGIGLKSEVGLAHYAERCE